MDSVPSEEPSAYHQKVRPQRFPVVMAFLVIPADLSADDNHVTDDADDDDNDNVDADEDGPSSVVRTKFSRCKH